MIKKEKILLTVTAAVLIIAVTLIIVPPLLNPLRRSNGSIHALVLRHTPLGSSMKDVRTSIETEGWHPNHAYDDKPEFKNQMRARLGSYRVFFERHVNAVWYFDQDEHLTNVFVYTGVVGF